MNSIRKQPFLKAGLIIAFLFIFNGIGAQSVWTIGPRAGAGYTWITDIENMDPKVRFTGGAFVMFSRWEHFGLSADLLYAGKGITYDYLVKGQDFTNAVNFHYIELPILATYFFNPREHSIRPKLYAGPSVNYMVYGEHTGTYARRATFQEIDYALVVGGGFNFKLAPALWLNLDARYNHGLINLNEYSWFNVDNVIKNRSVSFTVGLGFGIGGNGGNNDAPVTE